MKTAIETIKAKHREKKEIYKLKSGLLNYRIYWAVSKTYKWSSRKRKGRRAETEKIFEQVKPKIFQI